MCLFLGHAARRAGYAHHVSVQFLNSGPIQRRRHVARSGTESCLLEAPMRFRFSPVAPLAVLLAGTIGFAAWNGGLAAPPSGTLLADKRPNAIPVDTELVLAVDVSYSMDPEEQQLQREGYIAALTSNEFMQALKGGINGKVAVT